MLRDDIERLWHNYRSISAALNNLNALVYGEVDAPPSLPIVDVDGNQLHCYNGRNGLDPYQTLVELEVNCGVRTSIESLMVFHVMNIGLWGAYFYFVSHSVFAVDDDVLKRAISKDVFYAFCFSLSRCSKDKHRFFIEVLEKIDKLQPLFLAKLFTSDIKRFIEWIDYAKSEKLQAFIVKSFIQKTPINPPMFRKVVSLFKQEMTQLHMLKMFTN